MKRPIQWIFVDCNYFTSLKYLQWWNLENKFIESFRMQIKLISYHKRSNGKEDYVVQILQTCSACLGNQHSIFYFNFCYQWEIVYFNHKSDMFKICLLTIFNIFKKLLFFWCCAYFLLVCTCVFGGGCPLSNFIAHYSVEKSKIFHHIRHKY